MGLLGAIGDLLKKQPDIPEFKPISPQDEQVKATRGNTSALSDIRKLAMETDKLSTDQFLARLNALVPDSEQILKNNSKNISDMSRGEIPESVSSAVSRNAAARAYAGGYSGSERSGFLRTRDLGLTSLDMTQRGLDNATRWLQFANSATPQFNVGSMFISPEQQLKNTWMNTEASMNNQWMRNQQKAEKSLGTIFGNALIQEEQFLQQAAIAFVGGSGSALMGGGGMGAAKGMSGMGAKGAAAGAPSGFASFYPPDGPPRYSGY